MRFDQGFWVIVPWWRRSAMALASRRDATSAASCLLRLMYAFTYCAGISRTSWPSAPSSRAQLVLRRTRFQPYHAAWKSAEETEHLAAAQPLAQNRRTLPIDAVD